MNNTKNSSCIKNSLKCCLSYFYNFFINKNVVEEDLDENFHEYLCCNNIKNKFLNELLNNSDQLSFRLVEDDDDEVEENNNSDKNCLVINEKKLIASCQEEKSIQEVPQIQSINSKQIIKNKVKKSVTFLQDPKYGFIRVEIPEWQDTFREPVTPRIKQKKLRPEWKSEPIKNSYDTTKSILKKSNQQTF